MLVLERKTGQKIMIGEDIEIVVIAIKKGQIKLGIQAPIDVPVHREEIYERILKERENGRI